MESVYLETTFISYLVARPSSDALVSRTSELPRTGGLTGGPTLIVMFPKL